jgi:hypothetical protein
VVVEAHGRAEPMVDVVVDLGRAESWCDALHPARIRTAVTDAVRFTRLGHRRRHRGSTRQDWLISRQCCEYRSAVMTGAFRYAWAAKTLQVSGTPLSWCSPRAS